MKKTYCFILMLLISIFSLTSCWISPNYKDYEEIDGILFFYDYETMKSVILPKINKSFSAWHWNNEDFDNKYEKYRNNISKNSEDLEILNQTEFSYSVRNKKSAKELKTTEGRTITSEFFWITSKDDDSVIFFQN